MRTREHNSRRIIRPTQPRLPENPRGLQAHGSNASWQNWLAGNLLIGDAWWSLVPWFRRTDQFKHPLKYFPISIRDRKHGLGLAEHNLKGALLVKRMELCFQSGLS